MKWNSLKDKIAKMGQFISNLHNEIVKKNEKLRQLLKDKKKLKIALSKLEQDMDLQKSTMLTLSHKIDETKKRRLKLPEIERVIYVYTHGTVHGFDISRIDYSLIDNELKLMKEEDTYQRAIYFKLGKDIGISQEEINSKSLVQAGYLKFIKDKKTERIDAQKAINDILRKDEVIELTMLSINKYKIIVRHTVYKKENMNVYEGDKEYVRSRETVKDEDGNPRTTYVWYKCRERNDKRITKQSQIERLNKLYINHVAKNN